MAEKAYGHVKQAKLPGRKFIKEFFVVCDINGDDCLDAAILIQRMDNGEFKLNPKINVQSFAQNKFDNKLGDSKPVGEVEFITLAVVFGDKTGWFKETSADEDTTTSRFLLKNVVISQTKNAFWKAPQS